MKKALPLLLLLSAAASGPVLASDSEWQRCRQIPEPGARLACYDQIQLPAEAATPAAIAAANVERFGLEIKLATANAPDSLQAQLSGSIDGWGPGSRFTLTNGQIWQVVDNSRVSYSLNSPKITIRRGLMGAFYMDFEGLNSSPKVNRVK